MKIAVFGDVHGNLPALKAVIKSIESSGVEQVICLGDLAFKGPEPGDCVSLIRAMSIPVVSGNTDRELCSASYGNSPRAHQGSPPPASIPYYRWHTDRMTPEDIEYLSGLPRYQSQTEDGSLMRFSHCLPADMQQGTAVLLYGHTHVPLVEQRSSVLVANPGAVGFSLDGDWRASYLILDTKAMRAVITRVEYEMEQTIQATRHTGFCFNVDWYASALRSGWWEPIPWEIRARTVDNLPGKARQDLAPCRGYLLTASISSFHSPLSNGVPALALSSLAAVPCLTTTRSRLGTT